MAVDQVWQAPQESILTILYWNSWVKRAKKKYGSGPSMAGSSREYFNYTILEFMGETNEKEVSFSHDFGV